MQVSETPSSPSGIYRNRIARKYSFGGCLERKWWVLIAVGVAAFMSPLDGSVANIILPVVSLDLQSDIATVEWVVTIYLLLLSSLLLTFGRLGDLRGHKAVYTSGSAIFIIGSALCGLAPSAPLLIGFRALQGIGAAMIYSNSPAILTANFPVSQRGQALGLQATMTYLGLMAGPSLGGWLTTQFSWHAVFFINVPIGIIALLLSLRFIPADVPEMSAEPFDRMGAISFTGGLVALLLALNQGSEWGWTSTIVIGLILVAAVLLGTFIVVERRRPAPMLDLSLFTSRIFSASVASAVLNYVALYVVIFLLPFYLIEGRGLTTAQAGLILTAQPIVMVIAAPISGTLSDRIGSRVPGTLGMGILALGLFMLSRIHDDSSFSSIALALALAGLGTGIFISPNTSALLGSAPRHRQGIASGVLATARNVGMVLGVGLAGAVFTTLLGSSQPATAGAELFRAIDAGFVVSAGVAVLGTLTSAVRGG